jgi:DNA-binding response OmpR family regulator
MTEPRNTVLVVDDQPGSLGLLNAALESAGYTVLLAHSAAFAFSVLERVTPDVILLDAVMPGMDGFEACRIMKQRGTALAAVPVIFMTGLTETEQVLRGFEAGGVDYVIKPVSPDEVIARATVHLTNARRARSAQLALDVAGRFLVGVNRAGQLLWATPQAALLLDGISDSLLPDLERAAEFGEQTLGQRVATLSGPRGAIDLLFVGQFGPDEIMLRVVAVNASGEEATLRDRLRLTAREAEVLLWISRGKSNRDVGEILGLRLGTVTRHLDQIYTKLGVENRAAAAGVALRVLLA